MAQICAQNAPRSVVPDLNPHTKTSDPISPRLGCEGVKIAGKSWNVSMSKDGRFSGFFQDPIGRVNGAPQTTKMGTQIIGEFRSRGVKCSLSFLARSSFDQHHMDTAIAIADPRRDDLVHALSNLRSRVPRARLALRRSMLPRHPAGPALAVAVRRHDIGYNILHERWPGNFFDSTSGSTALSRLSSATSRFSRAFSSTTCLSSRT